MHFLIHASTTLAIAGSSLAGLIRRQQYSFTDADILNYALTLEHLENEFYRKGIANFTAGDFAKAGYGADFYENLKEIAYDEVTHIDFLTAALKGLVHTFFLLDIGLAD